MRETKRVKIPTGFKCNLECKFCYYNKSLDIKNPPIEKIKKILKTAKDKGIKDVDFSGGEPTIRPDLPELIRYAKELSFRKICIITNGQITSSKKYLEKLVKNGLNEILVSVHGVDKYNFLTSSKNGFRNIEKTLQNVNDLGIKLRTNTTITKPNYKELEKIAKFIKKYKPSAVNFIIFNDWCDASVKVEKMACKYSEVTPNLKKAIDVLDPYVPKVTVRYIPFCLMKDYEKHICNLRQLKYDLDEWVPRVKDRLETGILRYYYHILRGLSIKRIFKASSLSELFDDIIIEDWIGNYVKHSFCKNCRLNKICMGLEKNYADVIGLKELKPIPGKIVEDMMYFRKDYIKNYKV